MWYVCGTAHDHKSIFEPYLGEFLFILIIFDIYDMKKTQNF